MAMAEAKVRPRFKDQYERDIRPMLIDPDSGEPTRVQITREGSKRKRVAKKSGKEID